MKKILSGILIILLMAIIYLMFIYNPKFEVPDFDKNAKKYDVLKKISPIEMNENYVIYIDGDMKVKKDVLKFYFASDKKNKVYTKIRIYQGDKIIGESGIIKPGEYIENISLNEKINDSIEIKVMGYDMDTYQSAGSANFEVKVNKK